MTQGGRLTRYPAKKRTAVWSPIEVNLLKQRRHRAAYYYDEWCAR
jgi:hypothetical protein